MSSNYMDLRTFKARFAPAFGAVRDFDMRKAQTLKAEGKLEAYMRQTKEELADCMGDGGLFVLNIDDSPETVWEDKYDPSLYEFYRADSLPMQLTCYNELRALECCSRVFKGTKHQAKKRLHPGFFVMIWSAYAIQEELDSSTMRRRVEERFEVGFQIPQMDVLILNFSEKPAVTIVKQPTEALSISEVDYARRSSRNEPNSDAVQVPRLPPRLEQISQNDLRSRNSDSKPVSPVRTQQSNDSPRKKFTAQPVKYDESDTDD